MAEQNKEAEAKAKAEAEAKAKAEAEAKAKEEEAKKQAAAEAKTKKPYIVLKGIMNPTKDPKTLTHGDKLKPGTVVELTDKQAEHFIEIEAIRPAKKSEMAAVEGE